MRLGRAAAWSSVPLVLGFLALVALTPAETLWRTGIVSTSSISMSSLCPLGVTLSISTLKDDSGAGDDKNNTDNNLKDKVTMATVTFPGGLPAPLSLGHVNPAQVALTVQGSNLIAYPVLPSASYYSGNVWYIRYAESDILNLFGGRTGTYTFIVSGTDNLCAFRGTRLVVYSGQGNSPKSGS